ncbi:MAG: HAD-IIIA family hydrolase [Bacteroidales bacterium]
MQVLGKIDAHWTLFLDRDGVINQRYVDDYVKKADDFIFLNQAEYAIANLSKWFARIFVVTNQQGLGKGLMSEEDLNAIHTKMINAVQEVGGKIDAVYYCPDLKEQASFNRKPQGGMALKAKKAYPEIHFKQSVMVGDTFTDMLFGKRLGMLTVLIGSDPTALKKAKYVDARFDSLADFAQYVDLKITKNE